jgi:shikimate kinase
MTTARDIRFIKDDSSTAILAVFSRAGSPCYSRFENKVIKTRSSTAILAVFSRAGSPCHSRFEKRLIKTRIYIAVSLKF